VIKYIIVIIMLYTSFTLYSQQNTELTHKYKFECIVKIDNKVVQYSTNESIDSKNVKQFFNNSNISTNKIDNKITIIINNYYQQPLQSYYTSTPYIISPMLYYNRYPSNFYFRRPFYNNYYNHYPIHYYNRGPFITPHLHNNFHHR